MKFLELIDKLINKIPTPIMNILNFLAMMFTIAAGIGIPTSIFAMIKNNKEAKETITDSVKIDIALLIIILIYLFIRYYHLKSQTQKNQRVISRNYYNLLHDYRNVINQIELYYKEMEQGNRNWEMDLITQVVSNFLVNELDNLCEMISVQTHGSKICGCIKNITPTSSGDITYNDATVMTFVRSNNSDSDRKRLDNEQEENNNPKIFENTDFRSIILGKESSNHDVFYQQNLIDYANQLKKVGESYDNTTKDWEKSYRATIVSPVRIANKWLHYKSQNTNYDIVGFLCLDTMDTNTFTENQRENFTYIVKSYASVFYNMMSKYQYYMTKFFEHENSLIKNSIQGNTRQKKENKSSQFPKKQSNRNQSNKRNKNHR